MFQIGHIVDLLQLDQAALCMLLNLIALLGDLNTVGFFLRPEQAGQPPHLLHTASSHGVPCAQPEHGAALFQDHLQQLNKYRVCNNMGVHGAPWVHLHGAPWVYTEHCGCAWSTVGVYFITKLTPMHHYFEQSNVLPYTSLTLYPQMERKQFNVEFQFFFLGISLPNSL